MWFAQKNLASATGIVRDRCHTLIRGGASTRSGQRDYSFCMVIHAGGDAALLGLLKQIPMFAELPDDALQQLAGRCVSRQMPAGTVLFTTGEECRGLYMIETGRVRIYRADPEGREQVLH